MYNESLSTGTPERAPQKHDEITANAAPTAEAFAALGLDENIVRALTQSGYTRPTPVQTRAIPACIEGQDLLVSSQTGSGKTAAFMLPALQRISMQPPQKRFAPGEKAPRTNGRRPRPAPAKPSVLVLTPTRELAIQVTTATTTYGKYLRRIECGSVLGGMPYPKQLAMLARMPDILVATPGRLLDHIGSGRIDLSQLQMLVFDEADRMLDMGFAEDIDAILESTPESRQTLMFSATLDSRVAQLAARMLKNPLRIEIAAATVNHDHIEQRLHYTDDINHKQRLLNHLLRADNLKQAIIFTATKREAEALSERLSDEGFCAGALHGDMHQGARNRTLGELRRGSLQVLVATDVAARGIDVPDITHVFNFDLPKVAEDYVHRIGRTGRAGRSGVAINLVGQSDIMLWRRIERLLKRRIDPSVVMGLEPRKPVPTQNNTRKPNNNARRGSSNGGGGYRGGNKSYGNSNNGYGASRSAGGGGNSSSGNNGNRGYAERRSQGNGNSSMPNERRSSGGGYRQNSTGQAPRARQSYNNMGNGNR